MESRSLSLRLVNVLFLGCNCFYYIGRRSYIIVFVLARAYLQIVMNSGKIILLDSVLQWTGVGYMVKKQEDSTLIKDVFRSSRFCMLLLSALHVVALAAFCVMYSIIPGSEFIFLVFLIYAVYNKRSWNFLKE